MWVLQAHQILPRRPVRPKPHIFHYRNTDCREIMRQGALRRPLSWEISCLKHLRSPSSPLCLFPRWRQAPRSPPVGESRLGLRTWNQRRGLRLAHEPMPDLQYTHDNVVAAGGLIAVLDSSNYGPLVIATPSPSSTTAALPE